MIGVSFNVLFLCTGNSARSIMAECILNRVGAGRFHAYSAGSRPKGELHAPSVALLRQLNYDLSSAYSKSWDEFVRPDAPAMDFVFTVCDAAAGEICPTWPGRPITAHWGVPDPAAFPDRVDEIYGKLERRIAIFADLRIEVLDRMSLKAQLDQIGRSAA